MIDSAKYKYLIIELIAILIATPHLSAQGGNMTATLTNTLKSARSAVFWK